VAGFAVTIETFGALSRLARQPAGAAGGIGGQWRAGYNQAVVSTLIDYAQAVQRQAAANFEESRLRPDTTQDYLVPAILDRGFYQVNNGGAGAAIGVFSHLDQRTSRDWAAGDTVGEGAGVGFWRAIEYGTAVTGGFARTVRGRWRTQRFPAVGAPTAGGGEPGWLTIMKGKGAPIRISDIAPQAPIRTAHAELRQTLPALLERNIAGRIPNPLTAGETALVVRFSNTL
jgi:hypothetical protein